MRIVLAGTRSFGAAALDQAVADGHEVAAVFAPVDDRLEWAAYRHGIPCYPVVSPETIEKTKATLGVAVHSHDYVGRLSRQATSLGWVGYHPSLLPRHRGKDAVEWTIRHRDPIAGGTVYWLDRNVDTGPIAAQDFCHVHPDWDASDLWREQLFPMGLRLIRRVLDDIEQLRLIAIPQDEAFATWEPSLETRPLYRPELPAIGPGPEGFEVIASREHSALA